MWGSRLVRVLRFGGVLTVRILVTYASPHGSTRGIAERIAGRLLERGLRAECLPVRLVRTVADYDAVIVGSALHGRAWLPEAADFLWAHADALRSKPVWLFSVGIPGALPIPLRRLAIREGPGAVAPFLDIIRPRETRLFSGVLGKETFRPISRGILRLMGAHYGDFRDWVRIDSWTDGISQSVGGLPAVSPARSLQP
jgi:menaquinone-dependent protoporphyrinogen oxidase